MSSTVLALVIATVIVVAVSAIVGGLCLAYLHEEHVRGTRPGRILFRALDAISRTLDRIPWF
ncbi:hypothetical protein nbrc107696_01390 [Gordonia spumicola]|uniref:Uncharacterized protein n=1 Tax=Gordonia spumicola TaxID=589161 RepID=A0A7I9V3B9_9ACTN|nr:hypothetical protein [Gordonia spumicola]GED99692.1 hypothetical protein nbrc107696_01390 [Gordonia spumicola]